jgi:hypothetical protein
LASNLWENVSEWFEVLLKKGIPALMIGLGWLSTLIVLVMFGSTAGSSAAFWVGSATGIMMILLGYRGYHRETLNGRMRAT